MDYLTLAAPSEAKYTEKMSRFLAFAHPAATVDEAKGIIAEYARKYHDARHVCWAYMLGAKRLDYQSTDNGEPSGTAGKPILGQINSFNLTDVVIVVVRYFGGIKLGTPGLIAAYREATALALAEAERIDRCEETEVGLTFPYMALNDVMRVVKSTPEATVVKQEFDNTCTMVMRIRADRAEALAARLGALDGTSLLGQ